MPAIDIDQIKADILTFLNLHLDDQLLGQHRYNDQTIDNLFNLYAEHSDNVYKDDILELWRPVSHYWEVLPDGELRDALIILKAKIELF